MMVLLQFSSEPQFEPELLWTRPWFGYRSHISPRLRFDFHTIFERFDSIILIKFVYSHIDSFLTGLHLFWLVHSLSYSLGTQSYSSCLSFNLFDLFLTILTHFYVTNPIYWVLLVSKIFVSYVFLLVILISACSLLFVHNHIQPPWPPVEINSE